MNVVDGRSAGPSAAVLPFVELRETRLRLRNAGRSVPGYMDRLLAWPTSTSGRALIGPAVDGGAWAAALVFTSLSRQHDASKGALHLGSTWLMVALAVAVQLAVGQLIGLYRDRWSWASFDEFAALARTLSITTCVLFVADLVISPRPVPVSAVVSAAFVTLVGSAGARSFWRLGYDRSQRLNGLGTSRVGALGAGHGSTAPHRPYGLQSLELPPAGASRTATRTSSRVYLSPPDVGEPERQALDATFRSGWVAPVGPDLDAFEGEVAAVGGRSHGVGLSSCTAGLHLALKELGVGPGDDVICSTFTFAATANAITYCGARPILVDSELATWNLSPDLLAEELEGRARRGLRTAAVIVVDLYGQCADYDRILPICERYGVPVVEDAAESLGASYRGRPAGSFGVAGVFSFNGNKMITTSGGGMLVTHDERLAARTRHLATQAREPVPHYEHLEVGYNYRLSNLLAGMGRAQLAGLPERVARRRAVHVRYRDGLRDLPGLGFQADGPGQQPNRWLTCITLDPAGAAATPEQLRLALEAEDIESRPTWKPMHLLPVFATCEARVDGTSERLFRTGLCLPSGSSLSRTDQDRVIDLLRRRLT